MTITSIGYAGSITAADWPAFSWNLVGGYTVGSAGDLKVTPTTGDRTVAIANGVAVGAGVMDTCASLSNISLPSVAEGSRWDLIAVHRNWSTDTTTIVRVEGTEARQIPGARDATPGTLDDQPLALVRVAAGSAEIQEVVDLRTWAFDGGVSASDTLVLAYMTRLGTQIKIGSSLWCRDLDSLGVPRWVDVLNPTWTTIPHLSTGQDGGGVYSFAYATVAGGVWLRGAVEKKTGTYLGGAQVAALPVPARPSRTVRFLAWDNVTNQIAKMRVTPAGAVFLDEIVTSGSTAGPTGIQFDGVFIPRG